MRLKTNCLLLLQEARLQDSETEITVSVFTSQVENLKSTVH